MRPKLHYDAIKAKKKAREPLDWKSYQIFLIYFKPDVDIENSQFPSAYNCTGQILIANIIPST